MIDKKEPNFKEVILKRYCEEFLPATKLDATVLKTSEQIMLDIRPLASISTNEISKFLNKMGYSIGMDDSTPVWLMCQIEP